MIDDRHRYPLMPASVVLDIGAYQGNFARAIWDLYRAQVHCFEPLAIHCEQIRKRLAGTSCVLHPYAVGSWDGELEISVSNDSSSARIRNSSAPVELVQTRELAGIWQKLNLSTVDLVKINIEGMEYELLEHAIDHELQWKMRNIQVQFHWFPGCEAIQEKVYAALRESHHRTWRWESVNWENWELNQ